MNDYAGILYAIAIIVMIIALYYSGVFDMMKGLSGLGSKEGGAAVGQAVGGAVVALGKEVISGTINEIKNALPPPKKKGEACSTHLDCEGWSPAKAGTLGCCNGKCDTLLADFTGIGWCNSECKDSPFSDLGTCSRGFHWPRILGEQCDLHSDCKDHMPGQNTLACQGDKCVQQLKDFTGVYYIPEECRDGPWSGNGTCGSGRHWPRQLNEHCDLNEDCSGFMPGQDTLACQIDWNNMANNKCVKQQRDYLGVYYLPNECRDGPWSGAGTCGSGKHWPRKAGEECQINLDCEGHWPGQNTLGCDKNVCVQQKKDWFGVYYNPSECVGKAFDKPGTC